MRGPWRAGTRYTIIRLMFRRMILNWCWCQLQIDAYSYRTLHPKHASIKQIKCENVRTSKNKSAKHGAWTWTGVAVRLLLPRLPKQTAAKPPNMASLSHEARKVQNLVVWWFIHHLSIVHSAHYISTQTAVYESISRSCLLVSNLYPVHLFRVDMIQIKRII